MIGAMDGRRVTVVEAAEAVMVVPREDDGADSAAARAVGREARPDRLEECAAHLRGPYAAGGDHIRRATTIFI